MKYQHISIEEREKIQEMLWQRYSIRAISRVLDRSVSSLSRELKRNNPKQRNRYTPRLAHNRALQKRKSRGRKERLRNDIVRSYVVRQLKVGYSPEQIAGRLPIDCNGQTISHEAIYQYIYAQIHRDGYGLLKPGKEDLRIYLKRRHKRRVKKGLRRSKRMLISKGNSIETRPLTVERRMRIGDWESDSVASRRNEAGLNTLVDRKSGLVLISKLKDKTSSATTDVINTRLSRLPATARHTATFDNGSENQGWRDIERTTGVTCYFAHPYSSWERGSNENTNGLIRWYFPKGTDFAKVTEKEIAVVEYALNTRPRKRLGWKTPLEVFNQNLRSVALQC